jgi:hypothetical protein
MAIFAPRKASESSPSGRQSWKSFGESWLGRGELPARSCAASLMQPTSRAPQTAVESAIVAVLRGQGAVAYERLIRQVADRLYEEELRRGASALDIGLFGSRLFDREVAAAIEAGTGALWELIPDAGK